MIIKEDGRSDEEGTWKGREICWKGREELGQGWQAREWKGDNWVMEGEEGGKRERSKELRRQDGMECSRTHDEEDYWKGEKVRG